MADFVFNIAKGAFVEKFRDSGAAGGILLLKVADTDDAMRDTDHLTALLATAADEATDASYARKTGLTGTITVDDTNNRVDVDMADQTWTALAGTSVSANACWMSLPRAALLWRASFPPRRTAALPLLRASAAISIVTFGRDS